MFARYRMTSAHWLSFFIGVLLVPAIVSMLLVAPVVFVLSFLGGGSLFGGVPPLTLVLGWGLIGVMIGGPVAVVGAVLCTLSSRVFGYFSFLQAATIGLLVAWPLAAGLGSKDPAIAWSLFLLAVIGISLVWAVLRWFGLLPEPIERAARQSGRYPR